MSYSRNKVPSLVSMYNGTENVTPTIDKDTRALNTVEYEHHEIHAGSHYYVCNFETINNDTSIVFSITTPDSAKWLHMTFEIEGTSQTEIEVREDAAVSGGDAASPINNNRNSSNSTVATIVKNPTISNQGTQIYIQSSGKAGTTPARADTLGFNKREREIILKQNSTTLFKIVSRDDGNIVSYCGEWYEHTNKPDKD